MHLTRHPSYSLVPLLGALQTFGYRPSQTRGLMGYFLNILTLRTTASPSASFSELLARVRASVAGALSHADLPFQRVVEAVGAPREPNYNPLVQAAMTMHQEGESGRILMVEQGVLFVGLG